jgi:hypothetical protein
MLCLMLGMAGCGGWRYKPPEPLPDDRAPIPVPSERSYNIIADLFDKQITRQIEESFDLSRQIRNATGTRKEAFNVDAFGEVPNSSWFTNRNAANPMSIEEITRGPDTGDGPDAAGPWTVVRAKAEGVTPGFTIRDSRSDMYLIKFDPVGYGELVTGAEVISTKLFHAAGYFVPENYIVYFHPGILELGEKVKFTDQKGRKRFMTESDLNEIIDRIESLPDGSIRALASKYLRGRPLGPFKYHGVRRDDPNDIVPHQHRRELRGLRVMAAWVNHVDTKSGNSLDMYVGDDGAGSIRHYLIDFGTTLGSAAHGPAQPKTGHENQIDPHEMLLNLMTLGLYVRPYEKLGPSVHLSVGIWESELFEPGGYKFSVPNPAFDYCTDLDGYWGAKLVMSFTDRQLASVVGEGRYSDPAAAAYILEVLKERRDKIGRYWFGRVNPLDRFSIAGSGSAGRRLCFDDLAVETGLEKSGGTRYRYELRVNGELVLRSEEFTGTCIPLPGLDRRRRILETVRSGDGGEPQWEFTVRTFRESVNRWSRSVRVYLETDEDTDQFEIIGVQREG